MQLWDNSLVRTLNMNHVIQNKHMYVELSSFTVKGTLWLQSGGKFVYDNNCQFALIFFLITSKCHCEVFFQIRCPSRQFSEMTRLSQTD